MLRELGDSYTLRIYLSLGGPGGRFDFSRAVDVGSADSAELMHGLSISSLVDIGGTINRVLLKIRLP